MDFSFFSFGGGRETFDNSEHAEKEVKVIEGNMWILRGVMLPFVCPCQVQEQEDQDNFSNKLNSGRTD